MRMIKSRVKDSALWVCAALHQDFSQHLLPRGLRLMTHGVKVPIRNLAFEIGACLGHADEGDADLDPDNAVAPGVEGGEGAHPLSLRRH